MAATRSKTKKTTFRKAKSGWFSGWHGALVVAIVFAVIGSVYIVVTHAATGPRIAIAADASGQGYWVAASDGGVFSQGDATFYGSKGATTLPSPIVGMATTPDKKGYYLVSQRGDVYPFGDAVNHGDLPVTYPSTKVNNIVGMAVDPANGGYWLVGSDGGIFSFGATFYGSEGGKALAKPIVGMTSTANGAGYWLVGSDGGVFTFGNAPFLGSLGGKTLAAPISGIARQGSTNNYWLVGRDGGVFTFGSTFYGSLSGKALNGPILGISSTPDGKGYWLVGEDGGIFSYGDAVFKGTPPQVPVACPAGYSGTEPNCTKLVCPSGYTGTYPNCVAPTPTSTGTGSTPGSSSTPPAGTGSGFDGDGCGGNATHQESTTNTTHENSTFSGGICRCSSGTVVNYNGPIPNTQNNSKCGAASGSTPSTAPTAQQQAALNAIEAVQPSCPPSAAVCNNEQTASGVYAVCQPADIKAGLCAEPTYSGPQMNTIYGNLQTACTKDNYVCLQAAETASPIAQAFITQQKCGVSQCPVAHEIESYAAGIVGGFVEI